MAIYRLGAFSPKVEHASFIADSAQVIGDVHLGEGANVWFGAVLRGDKARISIGKNSNIQDGAVVHADPEYPCIIGDNVTIGHQAVVHGCEVGGGSLVGIQAVVLNGAKIGKNCLIGAGAIVTEGKEFPDNSVILGSPAKVVKNLTIEQQDAIRLNAVSYELNGRHYHNYLVRIDSK